MRVGLEREYGQKCVISYHVYMYIVSALDFAVVVFRLWFLQTQELGMLSLSPSLVLCICLLFNFFPSSVLYNKNSRERTKRTVVQ
jgi:hypothetical protein